MCECVCVCVCVYMRARLWAFRCQWRSKSQCVLSGLTLCVCLGVVCVCGVFVYGRVWSGYVFCVRELSEL